MARLAEPDGIPLAKPVRSKAPLLIGLGVIVLVALAIGIGLGLVLLQPPAYDLEKLKASYGQAQALGDKALSAAPDAAGQPDSEIIASLDEKALVSAKDALKVALDKFKALSQRLAELKQHQAKDAALKELADSTDLQIEIASTRLKAVEDELWPRPGDVADMYSRMKSSVPLIEGNKIFEGHEGKSIASGFLIKPDGLGYLVVTNRHVVDDAPNGYAVRFLPEGKSAKDQSDDIKLSPKDVVHIHRNEDLAILKLPSEAGTIIEKLKVRPLKVAKDLKVGRPVWVVGNPGAGAEGILAQSLVKGDVSFIKEDTLGDPTLFRLTAPINQGNSGGPVLDKDGRVVGIVSRMIQGKSEMNFAVHFHKLQELIDLMSGKIDSPDLIALNAEEVRRVVVPQQQLTADLEAAVAPWKAKGFNRCQWQGKGPDANLYFIMPALRPEVPVSMPVIVRKFDAKKGNTYGILSVSGKTGDFDIEVYSGGADSEPRTRRKGRPESRPEIKPVFIHQANGTSKAIGLKGEEFREDFVADKDGPYEVRFVKSVREKELQGAVPEPIHVCACVVELTGVQWKPAEPTTDLKEEVDEPVLAAWMVVVKKDLGSYKGLSKTDFNTSTKYENGQKITESSGAVNFEKGQARAELVFVDGKIVKFLVKSDKLPSDWFTGPMKTELYRERGKEFLTCFMSNKPDSAFNMMHPALKEKMPLDKLTKLVADNGAKAGKLRAVTYQSENYDPKEQILEVRYVPECENTTAKPLVKFEFVGLKGHLVAFNLSGN
jgi:S1-C subfamily serine protease